MTKADKDPFIWGISLVIALIIVGFFSFGAACLGAWAVVSIWPSVPFWPAAILIWLIMGLFSRSSNNAS